jgi:hypothetical protein
MPMKRAYDEAKGEKAEEVNLDITVLTNSEMRCVRDRVKHIITFMVLDRIAVLHEPKRN